ncbi:MAG: THUMP domain-containing protein [Thermoplasmataceae archaeon]
MYIIRYSEIGLKGRKARNEMENLLARNVLKSLKNHGIGGTVKKESGRILIYPDREDGKAELAIESTMGVKSFSRCIEYRAEKFEEIVEIAKSHFSDAVRGKKFAVRSRRSGNQNFTSMDIDRAVGSALYDYSAGVDLHNPDIEIGLEIRDSLLFLYDRIIRGPGGLPLGSQGKLISLMSGGIDSPVATWMMMKRGSPCDIVFISLAHPVDTVAFLNSATKLLGRWCVGYDPMLHIIDGRPLIEKLSNEDRYHYQNVEFKKVLYLIAQGLAQEYGHLGIVTGESLGQVSSQTAENLAALSHGMDIPIFRPLIGMDKDEIVDIARRIDTLPDSDLGEFCSLFADRPITKIRADTLEDDMRGLDLTENLVRNRFSLRFSEIEKYKASIMDTADTVKGIQPNSIVIDLRSAASYDQWHYPGAISASLGDIGEIFSKHGKDRVYIVYCKKGLQSANAASKIKSLGGNAFYSNETSIRKLSGSALAGKG